MDDQTLLRETAARLCRWFEANGRPLPWREEPTPYRVWVSEIMLQQTRIEAVRGYFERFMAAFPTVEALAEAEEERVLKLWEGLGYYSRARNLKKAAERVVSEYGGQLPRTAAELRRLPGVGDYTAGAIASIACGEPEPAVDGNVLRVLSRLLADGRDVLQPTVRRAFTEALRAVYPAGREAGLLTQGLMELGETVCLPNAQPLCEGCPLADLCRGRAEGTPERYPLRSPKKPRRVEERTVLLLSAGGRWAVAKRPDTGLLAGLWEFPALAGHGEEAALRLFLAEQGGEVLSLAPCGEAKHVFTHVEWRMQGWLAELAAPCGPWRWETAETILRDLALPSAFRKYKELLV